VHQELPPIDEEDKVEVLIENMAVTSSHLVAHQACAIEWLHTDSPASVAIWWLGYDIMHSHISLI
jgi:hypothetical protein